MTRLMLLERLAECLAYAEKYAPKYDAAALQARLDLPLEDIPSWDALLSQAPAALIHRSEALREAARVLTDDFSGMPETAELESFFDTRRQLLGQDPDEWAVAFARRELTRPRALLIFDPGLSLFDGTAQVGSGGYLGYASCPPWDTWLLVLPSSAGGSGAPSLLSWVPEWAGDAVDAGLIVEPMSCLSWAQWRDESLVPCGWGQE